MGSAVNLKKGDKVLNSDGKYGIIKTVKVEHLSKPETTYNFEVEDFHTYYVGEQGVCVHNNNCGGDYKPLSPDNVSVEKLQDFLLQNESYIKSIINYKERFIGQTVDENKVVVVDKLIESYS